MQFVPVPFPVPAPPPGIPEWVKILITALLSLVVGILLEPVRAAIQFRIGKNRTCTIVANEINSLAMQMGFFLAVRRGAHSATTPMTQKPTFSTECYDNSYDKNREHLYLIPGWSSLRRFYREIKAAGKLETLNDDQLFYLLMEFALLDERIRDGMLGRQFKRIVVKDPLGNLSKIAAEFKAHASQRTS